MPAWIRWIARTLLPPATPQLEDEERESIWSISRKDARTFFRLVSWLWLAAVVYLCRRTAQDPAAEWKATAAMPGAAWPDYAGDFVLAVLGELSLIAVGIAIIALLLTRPLNIAGELLMTLYATLVNRFVMPVIEAHKDEGRAEGEVIGLAKGEKIGLAKGEEIGLAKGRAEWREWNRRRMDAADQGRPFDEPPPGD